MSNAIKDYIIAADDVCYTCWEIKGDCECSEGFDSTRAREKTNDFDEGGGPKSVEEIADRLAKACEM